GNVLHVGNGLINTGVFLAENPCNPGQLMAFAGPVSSFHTEVTNNFKRLTDQEWEDAFWSGYENFPERPDWVSSYLIDHNGNEYPEGRALKGALYTGVPDQPGAPQLVDYLLMFPNPVSEEAHVRFVLNREADFSMVVYDMAGRVLHREQDRSLYPAEHDIVIPVESWSSGIYLLQIQIGERRFAGKLMVQ
ncbi:MAG: T9SS type A sorting domain-containing protein, partial [Bacteroidales bacterium]|nr:T9SS type A sorting domain-containing protein [Bacteroidales bacterium]